MQYGATVPPAVGELPLTRLHGDDGRSHHSRHKVKVVPAQLQLSLGQSCRLAAVAGPVPLTLLHSV